MEYAFDARYLMQRNVRVLFDEAFNFIKSDYVWNELSHQTAASGGATHTHDEKLFDG